MAQKHRTIPLILIFLPLVLFGASTSKTQTQEQPAPKIERESMTIDKLSEIVLRLDSEARSQENSWSFKIQDIEVTLIYDNDADRMRLLVPIISMSALKTSDLIRLMQANFDSALDARYAVAQNTLWSTFIHPLSPLTDREFLEGVGQVINLYLTYGTTYTSGALVFGGGDSEEIIRRQLIDDLIEKGTPI